jgi:dCTP deaminase
MFAVQPIRIYPGISICQIFFHELAGEFEAYTSKYQTNHDIQPSLLFKELNPEAEKEDPQMLLDLGFERSHP